jgi:DNA-binding response OmpR family regulator
MSDGQAILYVEDEDLIRELTAVEIEDAGYGVVVVENGEDALEALDGDANPFSALVTDVNLGRGPDGWEVGKRARELDGEIPVIYMTGASGHEWRSKGVPNSVLIRKPFRASEVIAAIAKLLKNVMKRS